MKNLFIGVLFATFTFLSGVSQATIIQTLNENDFNPLKINTSFEEFYNYGGKYNKTNAYKYSSNTGYEVSDYLTLLFVENTNKEVALFGLIDKAVDGSKGELALTISTISGDSSLLSFLLIDDSGDAKRKETNLSQPSGDWDIKWKWAKQYNDGFILGGFEKDHFTLSLSMNSSKGLKGFNTLPSRNLFAANSLLAGVPVPEPSIALLFFVSLVLTSVTRRHAKR